MALSNYQLILLDNLIYLGIFEKLKGRKTVENVVRDLLDGGEISQYWKDELA